MNIMIRGYVITRGVMNLRKARDFVSLTGFKAIKTRIVFRSSNFNFNCRIRPSHLERTWPLRHDESVQAISGSIPSDFGIYSQ